jgi:thiosulfate/3-mercaptopyruvate sulfurtransferase
MPSNHTTLIPPAELVPHLNDSDWVVIDCRFTLTDTEAGRRAYAQGHVPGARYAHLDEDLSSPITPTSGRHPLPDPDTLARKLGAWGVDESKQVVVYDATFGSMAARLWWLLRWLGHQRVALLDGGFPRWQREGFPVTADMPRVVPATFASRLDPTLLVDAATVERMRTARDRRLLDARAEERFSGEIEPLDKVAGHVPGALNLPWEDNLDFAGNYQTPAELRALYAEKLGDVAPTRVVHMCGSGVTACHSVLAMEHAGLKGSRLYAGSWSEWITDPKRPVVTGP